VSGGSQRRLDPTELFSLTVVLCPVNKLDPYGDRDLREVHVWSTAALRRMADLGPVLGRISAERRIPLLQESVLVLGDAGLAAVALYLALDAARRYLETHPRSTLPMARELLDDLYIRARAARDAVVHLEDKMSRSQATRIEVNGHQGITVVAPVAKRGAQEELTRIDWTEMERAARDCLMWLAQVPSDGADSVEAAPE